MENKRNVTDIKPNLKEDDDNDNCNDVHNDDVNKNGLSIRIPLKKRRHITTSSASFSSPSRSLINQDFVNKFWRVNEVLHDQARLNLMKDEVVNYEETLEKKIIDSSEVEMKSPSRILSNREKTTTMGSNICDDKMKNESDQESVLIVNDHIIDIEETSSAV